MDYKAIGQIGAIVAANIGFVGITLKFWDRAAQKGSKAPEQPIPEPAPAPEAEPAPSVNPYHDLHTNLVALIREGRGLRLHADPTGWVGHDTWFKKVMAVLRNDGYWMPEIEELQLLGDLHYEKPEHRVLTPAQILARQIRALETFAWRLHRQEVI